MSNGWIGPQPGVNSMPVVVATDQGPIPVQLTATPTIDIGVVDQGLPAGLGSAWPVKITDGSSVLGTPANPIRNDPTGTTSQPVSGSVAVIGPVSVSGSVAVTNFPGSTNVIGSVAVTNFPATQEVTGSVTVLQGAPASLLEAWPVELTDGSAVLGISANPVYVYVSNFPGVQPVSGSISVLNFPAVQPVSGSVDVVGSVAVTNFPGTQATTVSGNVTVVQPTGTNLHTVVDGSVAVSSVGGSVAISTVAGNVTVVQPTGTNLHAVLDGTSAVTVSGTPTISIPGNVTVVQPTGTNLHTVVDSGSVAVSSVGGSVAISSIASTVNTTVTALPNFSASVNITAVNQIITASIAAGLQTVTFLITGTWAGTFVAEGIANGGSITGIKGAVYGLLPTGNGAWVLPCGGLTSVQLRASAWTSGTAAIVFQDNAALNLVNTIPVLSDGLNRYSLPISIRQTAATGAGSTIFAMRNATSSVRKVYIEKLELMMTFDGTAAATTTKKYDLVRFSAATPTAGTALTVIKNDNDSDASNITDARFVDTGLSMTSVVFETAFMTLAQAISVTSDTFAFEISRDPILTLKPGEGFCIRLNTAATVGEGINGTIAWSER